MTLKDNVSKGYRVLRLVQQFSGKKDHRLRVSRTPWIPRNDPDLGLARRLRSTCMVRVPSPFDPEWESGSWGFNGRFIAAVVHLEWQVRSMTAIQLSGRDQHGLDTMQVLHDHLLAPAGLGRLAEVVRGLTAQLPGEGIPESWVWLPRAMRDLATRRNSLVHRKGSFNDVRVTTSPERPSRTELLQREAQHRRTNVMSYAKAQTGAFQYFSASVDQVEPQRGDEQRAESEATALFGQLADTWADRALNGD